MDKQRKNANVKYCSQEGQSTIEKRKSIRKGNMKILLFLSEIMIPLVLFYIVGFGMLMKNDVYENFVRGAREGLKTVVRIFPTLVGLMMAVGILRASGFLNLVGTCLGRITDPMGFPAELVPLVIVRMFSASAATGLVLDLFREFGTDSRIGLIVSIMMSCTETIFYTISVYFIAAKVKNTRYTVPGALLATAVGIGASVWLAGRIL